MAWRSNQLEADAGPKRRGSRTAWANLTARTTPIGVDVGSNSIKAAQLRVGPGGRALVAIASLTRAAGADAAALTPAEASRLARVLDRQGFAGKEVVLAAAPAQVVQSLLELPPTASAIPLASLVRNEICAGQRLDAAQVEVAHWEVPQPARGGRSIYVMASAFRHADADAVVETFAGAGLDVSAIDLNLLALARGCQVGSARPDGLVPIIDLGWSGALLVIVLKGTVVFQRTLGDAGVSALVKAAAQQSRLTPDLVARLLSRADATMGPPAPRDPRVSLPVDDLKNPELSAELTGQLADAVRTHVDRLASEVQTSISYVLQRYPGDAPTRVTVVGGGARLPGAVQALSAGLGMECVPEDDFLTGGCSPAMALASGLALFGCAA